MTVVINMTGRCFIKGEFAGNLIAIIFKGRLVVAPSFDCNDEL